MKPKFLLCLALLLSGGLFLCLSPLQAQTNDMPDSSRYVTTKKSDWSDIKVTLYRSTGEKVQLDAKAGLFDIKMGSRVVLPDALLVAFVDVQNSKVWIGLADGGQTKVKDFYVETDLGIVGVMGGIFVGTIIWQDNSIMQATPAIKLNDLIEQFDRQINMQSAAARAASELRMKTRMNFRPYFRDWFFYQEVGASMSGSTLIQNVEVHGGRMRLDFTSEALHIPGSVWIDLNTWKLVKAVEYGKQVYPK
jgi:hypothetical protein